MMAELFASGHAVDIVFTVLAIEALLLLRAGWKAADVLTTLLPAALILLGTRAALVGAHWTMVALPLAASFPAHLADLARRGKAKRDRSPTGPR